MSYKRFLVKQRKEEKKLNKQFKKNEKQKV